MPSLWRMWGSEKMSNPKLLYNPFTPETMKAMKKLIDEGLFESRSQLLRLAVDKLLMAIDKKKEPEEHSPLCRVMKNLYPKKEC